MRASIRAKIVKECETKIAAKEDDVGVSFYAFFANKNDDPELLMEIAQWWIMEMKLDHFEKARKIISNVAIPLLTGSFGTAPELDISVRGCSL